MDLLITCLALVILWWWIRTKLKELESRINGLTLESKIENASKPPLPSSTTTIHVDLNSFLTNLSRCVEENPTIIPIPIPSSKKEEEAGFAHPTSWPSTWRIMLLMYLTSGHEDEPNYNPMAWLRMGSVSSEWRKAMFDFLPRFPKQLGHFRPLQTDANDPLILMRKTQALKFRRDWLAENVSKFRNLLHFSSSITHFDQITTSPFHLPPVQALDVGRPSYRFVVKNSHLVWLSLRPAEEQSRTASNLYKVRWSIPSNWVSELEQQSAKFTHLTFVDFRHFKLPLEAICRLSQLNALQGLDLRQSVRAFSPTWKVWEDTAIEMEMENHLNTWELLLRIENENDDDKPKRKTFNSLAHIRAPQSLVKANLDDPLGKSQLLWQIWKSKMRNTGVVFHLSDDALPRELWTPPHQRIKF